ncbi:hypothetical protein LY76DRAFT_255176 [Colletotrichum caudatum]|nr:hypothetical protein LY76DRAFT_255176 [Colletotrichum caudatum]
MDRGKARRPLNTGLRRMGHILPYAKAVEAWELVSHHNQIMASRQLVWQWHRCRSHIGSERHCDGRLTCASFCSNVPAALLNHSSSQHDAVALSHTPAARLSIVSDRRLVTGSFCTGPTTPRRSSCRGGWGDLGGFFFFCEYSPYLCAIVVCSCSPYYFSTHRIATRCTLASMLRVATVLCKPSRCAMLSAAEMIKGTCFCLVVPARAPGMASPLQRVGPRQNTMVYVPSYDWWDISLVSFPLTIYEYSIPSSPAHILWRCWIRLSGFPCRHGCCHREFCGESAMIDFAVGR